MLKSMYIKTTHKFTFSMHRHYHHHRQRCCRQQVKYPYLVPPPLVHWFKSLDTKKN